MSFPNSDVDHRIAEALKKYADVVYRVCFLYMRNKADIDDIFQEVFLKLMKRSTPFENEEHEKAWLIKVAANQCKDALKNFWRSKVDFVDIFESPAEEPADNDLLNMVISLPQKYKEVIYLYYYEDYTVPEISKILNRKENTIYSDLHRGKALMKQRLGGTADEYAN
ncbi:MAG: RNA polymerase sigma factor [Ignavibacteriales bacterium]